MRLWLWAKFVLFFLKELWLSNVRLAQDVLRKQPRFRPALVAVPLDITSPFGIMVLANTITLTPGTLSVALADDSKTLYIHTVYLDGDKKDFVSSIKQVFEKRVMELFE